MQRSAADLKTAIQSLRKREEQWIQEKQVLLKTITLLEQEVARYKALNSTLSKKGKHKRVSSEEQTFIFNQTNISSYYPIVILKNTTWTHKANLRSHLDSVRTLLFHGKRLITAGQDSTLKVWEKESLKQTVRQHLGPVYCMTNTDELIFTGGAEGVVRKWTTEELINNRKPHFQGDFHEQPIWSMISSNKNNLLLTSSADQTHRLYRWSAETMEEMWVNSIPEDTPTSVDWLAENKFISGFSKRQKLGVFDIQIGCLLYEYSFQGKQKYWQTNKVQVSPKQRIIAAAHQDRFIRFYDPNSKKRITEMVAHSDAVTSLMFRQEGFELVSCGHDGNLRFWDLRKYKCVSDVAVHMKKYDESALCLGESLCERILCVGGADGLVKVLQPEQ